MKRIIQRAILDFNELNDQVNQQPIFIDEFGNEIVFDCSQQPQQTHAANMANLAFAGNKAIGFSNTRNFLDIMPKIFPMIRRALLNL